MCKTRLALSLSILLVLSNAVFAETPSDKDSSPQKSCYLFSYFMDNGQDGLHLAYSHDGLKWTALNGGKSILKPTVGKDRLMRDPSITQGPDGKFYMVWTSSWNDRIIGTASSSDLIHWSEQKAVPVMMHESEAQNAWAPEIFYDTKTEKFWIIWSTTITNRFCKPEDAQSEAQNDHRIYCTSTKDFQEFSPTKLFFEPGFSCIDGYLAQSKEGKYLLFYKDERQLPEAKKWIMLTSADNVEGPYAVGKVISPINWIEGPSTIQIGDDWIVYYDCYTAHHYGAITSQDLKHWTDITDQITFPQGTRHGTAFEVTPEVLDKLLEKYGK